MTGTGQEPQTAEDSDPSSRALHLASRSPLEVVARWAGYGIVGVGVIFALGYLLLVPFADWLAHHDVGNVAGTALETARNNARGSILALTAGVAGLGALVFTARNFTLQRRSLELSQRTSEENAEQARLSLELSRKTFEENTERERLALELSRRTLEVTEQGQVTDRFIRASDQLGSGQMNVRVGSIYALASIARDSERNRSAVMGVLTSFLDQHAEKVGEEKGPPPMLADIRAAAAAIALRDFELDALPFDIRLPGANLREIRIPGAHFNGANLSGADLSGADLSDAHLSGANLSGATLRDAKLDGAILDGAKLDGAHMNGARLGSADLRSADLSGADLSGAHLVNSNLRSANLRGTDLNRVLGRSADLRHADLRGANLRRALMGGVNLSYSNLDRADLEGADLHDGRFYDARMEHANLVRANLGGAHLSSAYQSDAYQTGANLRGANLSGADLHGADLSRADLCGATLDGATLRDAKLDGAWRKGTDHPIAGWTRDAKGKLQRENELGSARSE